MLKVIFSPVLDNMLIRLATNTSAKGQDSKKNLVKAVNDSDSIEIVPTLLLAFNCLIWS